MAVSTLLEMPLNEVLDLPLYASMEFKFTYKDDEGNDIEVIRKLTDENATYLPHVALAVSEFFKDCGFQFELRAEQDQTGEIGPSLMKLVSKL